MDQLADLGTWLGEGIASLAAVLDPAMVAIGGGVSEAGDLLVEPIRTAFRRQLTGRGHRPVADIVLAELGNKAGLIGAADLARRWLGQPVSRVRRSRRRTRLRGSTPSPGWSRTSRTRMYLNEVVVLVARVSFPAQMVIGSPEHSPESSSGSVGPLKW